MNTSTDNFLLIQTGANDDIDEDFEYDEIKLPHPSNNEINNKNKNKQIKNENKKKLDNTIKENINKVINKDKNDKKK